MSYNYSLLKGQGKTESMKSKSQGRYGANGPLNNSGFTLGKPIDKRTSNDLSDFDLGKTKEDDYTHRVKNAVG